MSSLLFRRMRQVSRTALVGLAPNLYWRFRRWRRGDEEFELKLLPLLCSKTRVSVDVGANFGMYTVRMAELSQRCIAFEPIPAFARMLARGFGNSIDVHAVALSDKRGKAELRVPDLYTGYATIDPANSLASRHGCSIDHVSVDMVLLDDFDFRDVGFMKIDVEGHEEAVLRGATATVERCRPNLIVEVEERHNLGSIPRVVAWMREHGYLCVAVVDGVVEDLAVYDLAAHQAATGPERYARNIVFIPKERGSQLLDDIRHLLGAMTAAAP
jgi:FkbM family methyltransferase